MKKILLTVTMAFLLTGFANAATLTLSPGNSEGTVGSLFTFDLNIAGLDDDIALSAYTIWLSFDTASLELDSVAFGMGLGDYTLLGDETEAMVDSFMDTDMLYVLFECSFIPSELDASQPSAFTLSTLSFLGLKEGTGGIGFYSWELSDTADEPNLIDADAVGATYTIKAGSPVPEPTSMLLFGAGLIALSRFRKVMKK